MNDNVTAGAYNSLAILILRLSLGILILFHGVAKLMHGIGPIEEMVAANGLPGFVAYGVYLGEVVGPLLLIAGFYARVGAGLIAVNMVFAVALAHAGDLFSLTGHGGWRLELQGMYLVTAIALVLTGPGRFSINQR
jgi:putative oxidoreductase